MHQHIYPLILVVCFGTAVITALPQQTINSGQNNQDIFSPYSEIPRDKWPRYQGRVVDPTCILTNLGKKHQKRELPRKPQSAHPSPGYCPAWEPKTETDLDRENRELCGEDYEPRCCVGKSFGFGIGTVHTPCYQYLTSLHCKNIHNGETYCCEIYLPITLDGNYGFNCRAVTFVSLSHAPSSSSSSPYSLLDNAFADTKTSLELPSDASSDPELVNSAATAVSAADWTADPSSNNYINIASASNADLVENGDPEVVSNPFWVD